MQHSQDTLSLFGAGEGEHLLSPCLREEGGLWAAEVTRWAVPGLAWPGDSMSYPAVLYKST